jgi:type I restriction enzyme R subunit
MTAPVDEYGFASIPSLYAGLSEAELVEDPAVELFAALGWETANLFHENFGAQGSEGRMSRREAFLPRRLWAALAKLNPGLAEDGLQQAVDELTRDRSAMNPVAANREVHGLLRDGVRVKVKGEDGEPVHDRVRLIDWRDPDANDFLLATQMWVKSELYTKRPDAVGFINGIPLVFAEFKAIGKPLKAAYDDNLTDYKDTVPHLFDANGFVILSNGIEAVLGGSHTPFDIFKPWKRIEDEAEDAKLGLPTLIRATCRKDRVLDITENFIAFEETIDGLVKKVAQNHQYLGVNKAIRAVQEIKANKGRLGVFWHTQGSGKSLSMVYFAEKVHRTVPGNWTFVLVTDRTELDDQIASTFVATGALTKRLEDVQAQNRDHLKDLLTGNERYVFSLIQKFSTAKGELYPKLSDRDDIIVITDEAHRSQYDQLAANMRRALPSAAFLGFTGTPLMAGEEETRKVFGDYISVYNFAQSVEDKATVPLYYDKRIPEVHLINDDMKEELAQLLDDADLDEAQEKRLEREFARQYHLITRDDRLDKIAADLVRHFSGRGYRGKAMFVAIDKATAVRMYDKVRVQWAGLLAEMATRVAAAPPEKREALEEHLRWLRDTDMAVVVSQGQNEVSDMKAKGLDILLHRARMVHEKLDLKFKKADDPLRLVFVCAMWITGFDVPTCSTIYIDKPMKNHTLMQTIARANRRAPGKTAGMIVDYVGVFANLQKALAIYARPKAGGGEDGDHPIDAKAALLEQLKGALTSAAEWCDLLDVDPQSIWALEKFDRAQRVAELVDVLISPDNRRQAFLQHAGGIVSTYKSILPDDRAADHIREVAAFAIIADRIRAALGKPVLTKVMAEIEALLERSIGGVDIDVPFPSDDDMGALFDLTAIDFEKLAAKLGLGNQKTKAEALRAATEKKVQDLLKDNPFRQELAEKLEKIIAEYNAGTVSVERLFEELLSFIKDLDDEEKRATRECLSEEELAVFDLLTKPEPKLTKAEVIEVKKIARTLLERLKKEKLVLDWWKKPWTKAAVRVAIEEELDHLPEAYGKPIWDSKVEMAFQFVYERYQNQAGAAAQSMH